MFRLGAVVSIVALALALCRPVAFAGSLATGSYDFGSQVLQSLFGETTDPADSVAAAYGDRTSESPLRSLALSVTTDPGASTFVANIAASPTFAQAAGRAQPDASDGYSDLAQTVRSRLFHSNVLFAAPAATRTDAVRSVSPGVAPAAFPVAAYQPVQTAPDVSLQSGAVSFVPLVPSQADTLAPVSAGNVAGAASTTESVPASLHVGPLQFQGRVEGNSTQVPQLSLHDSSYGAGANFAVRAGARRVNLNVSSSYEQLTRNDAGTAAAAPATSLQLAGSDSALVIPNYANMSRISLAAGVAVPLINGLTLNLNYDTARLLGSYGLPGLTNLDAIDNAYGGRLTFALPHSSSTLSLSAYQFRYQDNILPANSLTQTRENLNFTVKF